MEFTAIIAASNSDRQRPVCQPEIPSRLFTLFSSIEIYNLLSECHSASHTAQDVAPRNRVWDILRAPSAAQDTLFSLLRLIELCIGA